LLWYAFALRERVDVHGHLGLQERDRLRPALLPQVPQAQPAPLPLVHRGAPLKVREREGALPVAAVRGAQEGEERGVLRDRKQLPVAERPPLGSEGEREDADLSDKWIGHVRAPQVGDGKIPNIEMI
jgi:hypothetical protein